MPAKVTSVTLTLDELRAIGIDVGQHYYSPEPDEWFSNFFGGPFTTARAAVLATIKTVCELRSEHEDTLNNLAGSVVGPYDNGHDDMLQAAMFAERIGTCYSCDADPCTCDAI